MIYSKEIERHCIGGLLKYPEIFPEIDSFVAERDFGVEVHQTIFSVIKSAHLSKQSVDKVVIAQRITNLGISFKDDINIFEYLKSLASTTISVQGTIESFQELVKIRIRREIAQIGSKLVQYCKECGDSSVEEIISQADALYNNKISSFNFDEGPQLLFEDIENIMEEKGNDPNKSAITAPYPDLHRIYGGYRNKNIYAYVSRSGEGKTTLLCDIGKRIAQTGTPFLICDTEMPTIEIMERLVAAETGIDLTSISEGWFKNDIEAATKVRASYSRLKQIPFYHYHVGNKSIHEISSIIRRWKYAKVGRNIRAVACYDYFKVTNEKTGPGFLETQVIGSKVDAIKRVAEELDIPILSAMQLNRSGENFNKKSQDVTDDSSAISLSDRLLWFCSYVGIFRRKTLDEMQLDTPKYGTHKLITLKARSQGRDAPGHADFVFRQIDDKTRRYMRNYLNFAVENFAVDPRGCAQDVIKETEMSAELSDDSREKEETELV